MPDRHDASDMLERAEHAATAGDFASADALLRNAARVQEDTDGPLHPDLANTFNNLAIVAEKTGHPEDAETFYRRAVAIASASLPPEHPMVVASRENLESFCRARRLPIDVPASVTAPPDTDLGPQTSVAERPALVVSAPDPARPANATEAAEVSPATPGTPRAAPHRSPALPSGRMDVAAMPARGSDVRAWVAIAVVVLLIATLLILRPWSSRQTSAPLQTEVVAPRPVAPSPGPASTEAASKPAPPADNRSIARSTPATSTTGAVMLAAVDLCRNFSASGRNWRCERVGTSVAPGPIVLYTRVRSARADVVVHRWYHGDTLRQSVKLAVGANATEGYRTYSRQTVKDGDWRVEVRSADGTLLHEQRFTVK